jgi:hypothetical protein
MRGLGDLHPVETPTLNASNPPSLPTGPPNASWIFAGSGISDACKAVTTFGAGSFFTAVVPDGLQAPRTLPTAADGAEGPPIKLLGGLGHPRLDGAADQRGGEACRQTGHCRSRYSLTV